MFASGNPAPARIVWGVGAALYAASFMGMVMVIERLAQKSSWHCPDFLRSGRYRLRLCSSAIEFLLSCPPDFHAQASVYPIIGPCRLRSRICIP